MRPAQRSAAPVAGRLPGTQFDPTVVEAFLASLDASDEELGPAPFVDEDDSAFVLTTSE